MVLIGIDPYPNVLTTSPKKKKNKWALLVPLLGHAAPLRAEAEARPGFPGVVIGKSIVDFHQKNSKIPMTPWDIYSNYLLNPMKTG